MTALFISLALLILINGLAIGAYLSIYKFGIKSMAGRTIGTLVVGTCCSAVVALISAVLILPPIA